jgi:hypothetical protein
MTPLLAPGWHTQNPWLDIAFFIAIGLLVMDLVLLYTVVHVFGRNYSFFLPWRQLLMGLMVHTTYMLVSDIWWYLSDIVITSPWYAVRLIGARFVYSVVIVLFTQSWVQSIRQAKPPREVANGRVVRNKN